MFIVSCSVLSLGMQMAPQKRPVGGKHDLSVFAAEEQETPSPLT